MDPHVDENAARLCREANEETLRVVNDIVLKEKVKRVTSRILLVETG